MKVNINNELKKLENLKNSLEKKDIDLIISDFDDTIFCRAEQLEQSEILRTNRWDAGNDMILSTLWLDNYIKEFYEWKSFPNDIIWKMRKNHDLILTAWYKQIQDKKMQASWITWNIRYIVVDHASKKILETIRYVVEDLGFIPNKITIYEDRPKYFVENKKTIEDFLDTSIDVMFVEMKDNYSSPNIKKVA